MNAVVLHDGTVHPGGAVRVAIEAANALDADVVVGFSGPDRAWWEARCPNDVRILSSLQRVLNDVRNARRMRRLDLSGYELVLSSGPATKFYRPHDDQHRVHYLHHPPLAQLWGETGPLTYIQSLVDRLETVTLPAIIANSELTAARCRSHYGRRVDAVVNPPVDVDAFTPNSEYARGMFVMVGRLEDRKRPGLAVDAFNRLGEAHGSDAPTLHLVGDGPRKSELEQQAGQNITFHGFVDDDELVELLESANAGIFLARREDFGVTPVEYLAAGLPVVAVDEPNTNNQIEDGVTGILVAPEPDAVVRGVEELLARDWDRAAIAEAADAYRPARFRNELLAVVDGL
jgi:glycosyltransferase involved in cell wall biosynthesis